MNHNAETSGTNALERARRVLEILEEQAAGYTKLSIPPHLQVELEEKRREVAEMERRLEQLSAAAVCDNSNSVMNPFSDRGCIRDPVRFFGRQRLLREATQMLAQGNSLALIGEPQIGKSSLLYYLFATRADWLAEGTVLYLDLQAVLDEADFCAEVLDGLGEPLGDLRALRRMLRRRQAVLLLDEVEKLNNPEFSTRLHGLLRALAQEPTLTLAVAGHRPLAEIFPPSGTTSPFHNIFTEKQVPPFTAEESQAFLRTRLVGTHIHFSDADIERLRLESAGHPLRLQQLACALFNSLRGA